MTGAAALGAGKFSGPSRPKRSWAQPSLGTLTAKLLRIGAWDNAAGAHVLAVIEDDGEYLRSSATELV